MKIFAKKEKDKEKRNAALNSLEEMIYKKSSDIKYNTMEGRIELEDVLNILKTWLENEVGPDTSIEEITEKINMLNEAITKFYKVRV